MVRQHFRQTAIGHRAFVEISANQRHAALCQPLVHFLAGEAALCFLATDRRPAPWTVE